MPTHCEMQPDMLLFLYKWRIRLKICYSETSFPCGPKSLYCKLQTKQRNALLCIIITVVCGVVQSQSKCSVKLHNSHLQMFNLRIKWCDSILRWSLFFWLQETAVERNLLPMGQRYLVQLQRGDVQNVKFWIKYSYVWHCPLLFLCAVWWVFFNKGIQWDRFCNIHGNLCGKGQ